ncbi:MAG: hypothetical protein HXY19_06405 [Thermoanaerobaculaceae bacterium]|nr:hypothetical protein [Thermoanaerobaculaceae bacterium]
MRRVDPSFPDLLPLEYRLGAVGPPAQGVGLDPVSMRLVWPGSHDASLRVDPGPVRRPARLLVHAGVLAGQPEVIVPLLEAGWGVLVVLDAPLEAAALPAPGMAGQVTVLAPWLPALWGGRALPELQPWEARGVAAGVLLGLVPVLDATGEVERGVAAARQAGASFVLAVPVCVPPLDRRRLLNECFGEEGNEAIEDLFFHTDLASLTLEMERAASRCAHQEGLGERLPGPATARLGRETFAAATSLLLWARRLDLLDGVGSVGWQLRRAAQALMASAKDVRALLEEDNLRIIPGFDPWVEAFARAVWADQGAPFEEIRSRWLWS